MGSTPEGRAGPASRASTPRRAGDGWYWYEIVDTTVYADGTGEGICTGCHMGGADYVLTPFPLQ